MKLSLATLVTLLFASGEVYAHGHERSMHPREISSRQLAANKRHIQARNCAPQIAEYHRKRAIAKRNLLKKKRDTTFPYTTLAVEPQETSIKNTTCVTAPEVTEGPYYLNNDLIRQDLRETQGGILLELDIGVIDTSTCEPLPNALVEIWNCNATGAYSGFTTAGGTGGGENPGGGNNSSMSFSLDPSQTGGGAPPSGSDSAVPSGTGGMAPGSGGGGGGGSSKTDDYNFLRGGWQTNDAGIVAFKTIYPGFYTGRTVHIHTMVHQNITYNSNGTYTSKSGSLVHVGQMFFDDALNDQVMALSPYSDTSMTRMYNTEDSILAQENSNGYSAYVDASLIDESDISQGVLGFITIGVNSEATYSVTSNNYFTGDLVESVSPDSTDSVIISSSTASESTTTVAEDTTSTTESTSTIESTSTTASTSTTQSVPAQSPPSQSQSAQTQPGQPHHGQPNPGQPNPAQPNPVQSNPSQPNPVQSPPSRGFHKRRSPRY